MATDNDEEMSSDEYEMIAARIKHILEIYPYLSPTMLQAGLGPQVRPDSWRPVLEDMLSNGVIKQETVNKKSPANRHIDYQRISLAATV